ncbi:MAG: hypothetical protein KIS92_24310 [Planctomycetota bacterium]|nr:hypothetical protein [Planctomycetota bacterium]
MSDLMRDILERIQADPRYLEGLDCGRQRPGHPEGTIRGHVAILEQNLAALKHRVSDEDYWKLKILIHVHDTFKHAAKQGVPISDPNSHASLARAFLAEFCADADLQNMVQFHDEPFALWRQYDQRGSYNQERMRTLVDTIKDWDLFLIFMIVDGSTEGKDRSVLQWCVGEVSHRVTTRVDGTWILPQERA